MKANETDCLVVEDFFRRGWWGLGYFFGVDCTFGLGVDFMQPLRMEGCYLGEEGERWWCF